MAPGLLRTAAVTLAWMVVAGIIAAIRLRLGAADQANPWDAVLLAFAGFLVEAAPIVTAFLAVSGGLAALLFLLLVSPPRGRGRRKAPGRSRSEPQGGGEKP